MSEKLGDPDCICGGTGLVTRLDGFGGNTGAEICPCVVQKAHQQTLGRVAAAFETRKPSEAMLCSEVAAYCREQAALDA